MQMRTYWDGLNNPSDHAQDRRTVADAMEEYMALLDDAVKIRTQGPGNASSFLSGGLDSSAICALAAKHKQLDTYSIITQTTMLEDTTDVCDRLAREQGYSNTQFLVPYHELVFNTDLWKQRIWRAESPVNHTDALTKNLLHYGIGQHNPSAAYVLTGTGSDQYNGGLVRWIVNDADTAEQSAENFFAEIIDTENKLLIKREDEALWDMRRLINRDYLGQISGTKVEQNPWMYYVKSALHGDLYSLVWDEVRAGAAHGHSVRFPFMDHRFAGFIASVPQRLHAELFYDKQILRVPSKKILPDYVINKPKAPSFFPEYFLPFRINDYLTSANDMALVKEAFGDLDTPHPVIDKKALVARIKQLRQRPEIKEWNAVMQIINLGLLEQLADKTEQDMDMEAITGVPAVVSFADPGATRAYLEQRLSIKGIDDLLDGTLCFGDECSYVYDKLNDKYFLTKKNEMVYEIEKEYADWHTFLSRIDNKASARHILQELNVEFAVIEEFYKISLKEQILQVKTHQDN